MNLKEESTTPSENKQQVGLEILDTVAPDKLRRIISLPLSSLSIVFEVVREELLALKVYNPEIDSEDKDNGDDNDDDERKVVNNIENARSFLFEYQSINQLDHTNRFLDLLLQIQKTGTQEESLVDVSNLQR